MLKEGLADTRADAEREQRLQTRRIEQLTTERKKLLDAYYAGAIPLDLLKAGQDRIAGQLARIQDQLANFDANFEQARAVLADTLDLTRDCHAAYLEANDSTRRLFNQAFFAKIYIDEDDDTREQTVRIDYNEPFDSLPSRLVPARVHRSIDSKKTALWKIPTGGSSVASSGIAEVQSSHTSTLVEVIRGLSNPLHPGQKLIIEWKTREESPQGSSNGKIRAIPESCVSTPWCLRVFDFQSW